MPLVHVPKIEDKTSAQLLEKKKEKSGVVVVMMVSP
jgi:hypothetical protein